MESSRKHAANSLVFSISGMSCQKCVAKVASALMPYGESVSVTLTPPQATLHNPSAAPTTAQLNAALAAFGDYSIMQPESAALNWLKTYYPLLLIITLISVVSVKGATGWHDWMQHFMAGFFLVFGFFKLLDVKGFASAFAAYDLLAARSRAYAYAYPFIELALGFMFLFGIALGAANIITLIIMLFGLAGVWRAVANKQQIRCACLGTALNLPMSKVTVVENTSMALMAALMLV